MTLHDITHITGGILLGEDRSVQHYFIDSRQHFDASSLFFALKGQRHDGSNYIADLYSRGLQSFVVDATMNQPLFTEQFPAASFVFVPDTLSALQTLAAHHRSQFDYPVIGITGSNGKTIIKEWLAQLLHNEMRIVRNPKSYNSQVGVPLSVLLMNETAQIGLFEAGISEINEMAKLEAIIRPTIGIISNIGEAHQENFKSLEQKLQEKLQLFIHSKLLIYNIDQDIVRTTVQQQLPAIKTYTWGHSEAADVQIKTVERFSDHTDIALNIKWDKGSVAPLPHPTLTLQFTDDASIENSLHCITCLIALGFDLAKIQQLIPQLIPIAMRLELKTGINGSTIINDTYNSDINSLLIALNFLTGLTQHAAKTVILSDIQQSDWSADYLYQKVANLIAESGIDHFIGIGTELFSHQALFRPDSQFYRSTDDFVEHYNRAQFQNQAILIKGGRAFCFENITQLLEHKVHQTHLEVNLNAIVNNLNYFKSLVRPQTWIMAIVKAGSYGLGTHEIASLLQYHRVNYLAVAYADEGVVLRDAGISMPIVVLNPEPDSYQIMISKQLEPEIYSFSSLTSVIKMAQAMGETAYPIHIKLDTGMHRLGFNVSEIVTLCEMLKQQQSVKVMSVFSHLAAADDVNYDDFTREQIGLYEQMAAVFDQMLPYSPLKHLLNSAGIERFPEAQFDMVRLGLALYGIGTEAQHQAQLQNTAQLSSAIVQIKEIPKDETVGYGRKGLVDRIKKIAIIPIGYADGLDRKLSCGKASFWIKGHLAPIIGNVCMDTCMIDVTGIDVQEGDRVEIFGDHIQIEAIAKTLETIPYEILTSISQRVKRIYYYV